MKDYIILLAPLCGWIAAQSIKFVVSLRKDGISFSDLVSSGGFPSSHSAFVMALATVVLVEFGPKSAYFAITAAFCAIILYDSMGVRKTTGDQTEAIKELAKISKTNMRTRISESRGHNMFEVFGGAVIGVFIGLILETAL